MGTDASVGILIEEGEIIKVDGIQVKLTAPVEEEKIPIPSGNDEWPEIVGKESKPPIHSTKPNEVDW